MEEGQPARLRQGPVRDLGERVVQRPLPVLARALGDPVAIDGGSVQSALLMDKTHSTRHVRRGQPPRSAPGPRFEPDRRPWGDDPRPPRSRASRARRPGRRLPSRRAALPKRHLAGPSPIVLGPPLAQARCPAVVGGPPRGRAAGAPRRHCPQLSGTAPVRAARRLSLAPAARSRSADIEGVRGLPAPGYPAFADVFRVPVSSEPAAPPSQRRRSHRHMWSSLWIAGGRHPKR